jgi:hypothetical protein
MIGKIPKAGRGFKGVVSYLMHGDRSSERRNAMQPDLADDSERQTNARRNERANAKKNRVLWTETHNLITTDPEKAVRVMRATATQSRRCKAPVYHFVISWTPEEEPSTELMRAVVADTCRDMGLDDHQRITVAHDDTRHKHVHVVVNRVHHETGKAWNRAQDWVRLEQSLARQAKARGLRYVPGRHNAPEDFHQQPKRAKDAELQRARRKQLPAPARRWNRARLAAERKRLAHLFDAAESWNSLHAALADRGLSLKEKGQGHVLSDGATEVKLSSVSKTARIALLERRFQAKYQRTAVNRLPNSPARRSAIEQNPTASDVKPAPHKPYSRHPQQKRRQTIPAPPSTLDQPQVVTEHKGIDTTPTHSNARPALKKRKRRTRKGPKL